MATGYGAAILAVAGVIALAVIKSQPGHDAPAGHARNTHPTAIEAQPASAD